MTREVAKLMLPLLLGAGLWGQTPARPAFEVASIKPSAPQNLPPALMGRGFHPADMMQDMMPGMIPRKGSRVDIRNYSLVNLIAAAYSVKTTQISGPSWLGEQLFDVDAKIPEDAPPDHLNEMLQSLLEERFGLKMHRETRELAGFDLIVGKNGPKLTESAPQDETVKDDQSPEDRVRAMTESLQKKMRTMTPTPGMNRNTGRRYTSDKIAQMISRMVGSPVVDKTGLTGTYDITLETSPDRPDEPGVSIFQAVEGVGLKLVPRKVSVDTIVVDQVSKMPTPN
jgi:uncharacterized protein (TIGR03435 family)